MKKILYVEDNEMNRDMLGRRLTRREFEVIFAFDGQEGLDKMKSERQLFFSHRNFNRISIPLTILKRAKETLVLCNTTKKTLNIIKDIEKGRNFFKFSCNKKYRI